LVVRLVWDQEVAGSNPVSPTFINTGTMKKFSQYINSQEDCGCQEPVEEQIGTFLKGAAMGIGKTLGAASAEAIGGSLGKAVVSGGMEAMAKRKEGGQMLDREVIRCSKEVDSLRILLARRKGKSDEAEIADRLKDAEDECKKIKASTDVDKAEKNLAALRKAKADALRAKP
jgi:hypothetical protein